MSRSQAIEEAAKLLLDARVGWLNSNDDDGANDAVDKACDSLRAALSQPAEAEDELHAAAKELVERFICMGFEQSHSVDRLRRALGIELKETEVAEERYTELISFRCRACKTQARREPGGNGFYCPTCKGWTASVALYFEPIPTELPPEKNYTCTITPVEPAPAATGTDDAQYWKDQCRQARFDLAAAIERAEKAERQLAEAGKAWHELGYIPTAWCDKLPKPEAQP